MFDVVVIGGNLAGTTAAIKASSKGANVALIERNKEPFYPAHCGEMVIVTEAELLNLDKIGCTKNGINKTIINISSKEYIIKSKVGRIIIFNRNFIEKKLQKEAEKNGVKLLLGTSMKDFKPPHKVYLDNNEIIEGRIIIDASGIACQFGRRIGLYKKLKPEDIGVCIQSRVKSDFDAHSINMWFHEPYAPFGYAWLFPINEKEANIGLILPGGQKLDLAKLLKNYINDNIQDKYDITNIFRACVPLAQPMNSLIKDNVIITGDAARLSHSLSGGGIRNTIISGSLAGNIAARYIQGEIQSLEPHHDYMRKKISVLNKEYFFKSRAIKNENSYLSIFTIGISIAYFVNRFFPNLLEKIFIKFLEKDEPIF